MNATPPDPKPGLLTRINDAERRFRRSLGKSLDTPRGRAEAVFHYHVFDHAFLRYPWTNFAEVAPGVYRCNHPNEGRMARMQRRYGINTILNLRGGASTPPGLLQKESAARLGLTLRYCALNAKQAQAPDRYLSLLTILEELPKPFVMHCKSGADRTGLAAAFYLIAFEGAPVAEARAQLSWRFVHFRHSAAGVLDWVLDAYETEGEAQGHDLRSWLANRYDPQAVTKAFQAGRRG